MGRPDGKCSRMAGRVVEAEPLALELPRGAYSLSPAAQLMGIAWGSMGAHGGGWTRGLANERAGRDLRDDVDPVSLRISL